MRAHRPPTAGTSIAPSQAAKKKAAKPNKKKAASRRKKAASLAAKPRARKKAPAKKKAVRQETLAPLTIDQLPLWAPLTGSLAEEEASTPEPVAETTESVAIEELEAKIGDEVVKDLSLQEALNQIMAFKPRAKTFLVLTEAEMKRELPQGVSFDDPLISTVTALKQSLRHDFPPIMNSFYRSQRGIKPWQSLFPVKQQIRINTEYQKQVPIAPKATKFNIHLFKDSQQIVMEVKPPEIKT
ncbi:MAG: hypothetical protein OXU45_05415 [Candidatus Melainabacteria bacterium]|nr:hypothetical protein [Candidatus Melainabacteria bacterium]